MVTSSDTDSNRQKLLRIRKEFLLADPEAFKGNTRERNLYLKKLEEIKPNLTLFQKEYLIGLVLSDATVELDHVKKTARVKMQQCREHAGWTENVRLIFLEYMANDKPLSSPSQKRTSMTEIQTLKCKVFYDFLQPIFYQNQKRKSINGTQIAPYISPLCVAAWYCGDGSKADYTYNQGKGLTFHSQGFTQSENETLAEILKSNVGLKCHAKLDNPLKNQWRLDVSGESYDDFVIKVGPYVDKAFYYRVPSGRTDGSPFGYITSTQRDNLLGSAIQSIGIDKLVESY